MRPAGGADREEGLAAHSAGAHLSRFSPRFDRIFPVGSPPLVAPNPCAPSSPPFGSLNPTFRVPKGERLFLPAPGGRCCSCATAAATPTAAAAAVVALAPGARPRPLLREIPKGTAPPSSARRGAAGDPHQVPLPSFLLPPQDRRQRRCLNRNPQRCCIGQSAPKGATAHRLQRTPAKRARSSQNFQECC